MPAEAARIREKIMVRLFTLDSNINDGKLLVLHHEARTPQTSSSVLALRYTGSGRRLFPKIPSVQAKHDAFPTASPGKLLVQINGIRSLPLQSTHSSPLRGTSLE